MSNSTNDKPDLLTQYLDGELSGEEKTRFESRLAAEPELQSALDQLKMARDAIRLYGLKQEVAEVHRTMVTEKQQQATIRPLSSSRRIIRFSMSVAAGLLLLLAGFTAYNYFSLTGEKIFSENYQVYEWTTTRGIETPVSPLEESFRQKKYSDVVNTVVDRSFTLEEEFLRAISFTELGQNEKAINSYRQVIDRNRSAGTNVFREEAEYYLALTFIRNKNYNKALDLLQVMREQPGHLYHDKVGNKLIRQVKRLI